MTVYEPRYPRHTWKLAQEDVPAFERDMEEIRADAMRAGAHLARLIPASAVAVDERVTWKCRIPICECYGQTLMDPPFSPTAEQTEKVVSKYQWAILTDVTMPLPDGFWDLIQQEDVPLCRMQYSDTRLGYDRDVEMKLWFDLHGLVMEIERQAHNRGYLFAMGYVASTCYLCYDEAVPLTYCDTAAPCRHPYEARPSMEAGGMDVFSTYYNAGLKLKMASKDALTWAGLVLIV